jgi:hypothetical protein
LQVSNVFSGWGIAISSSDAAPPGIIQLGGVVRSRVRGHSQVKKKRQIGRFSYSSLAEVSATVLATENCSWLADEAILGGITIIVTAAVAVIVGI